MEKGKKVELITGITVQDESYLAEFLLEKGYLVHGKKRRSSSLNTQWIEDLYKDPHQDQNNFFLYYGDLIDTSNLINIIGRVSTDEICNLGAKKETLLNQKGYKIATSIENLPNII